jgi:hypothetical protein
MRKKVKCSECGQQVGVRKVAWGLIVKFHQAKTMDGKYECPGSGKLVK